MVRKLQMHYSRECAHTTHARPWYNAKANLDMAMKTAIRHPSA